MESIQERSNDQKPVVLFADDDTTCLDVGVKILQKLGYKVLDARDGREAIDVFFDNQNEVKLVILDMKMPYNGCTAFLKLKQINADVKVLISSGYAQDQKIRDMMAQGCSGFIQKPFRIKELSQKILEILKK